MQKSRPCEFIRGVFQVPPHSDPSAVWRVGAQYSAVGVEQCVTAVALGQPVTHLLSIAEPLKEGSLVRKRPFAWADDLNERTGPAQRRYF